jgi:hypothetical protein
MPALEPQPRGVGTEQGRRSLAGACEPSPPPTKFF